MAFLLNTGISTAYNQLLTKNNHFIQNGFIMLSILLLKVCQTIHTHSTPHFHSVIQIKPPYKRAVCGVPTKHGDPKYFEKLSD